MTQLTTMLCPECRQALTSRKVTPDAADKAKVAKAYSDCLRRCNDCKIGLSNTKDPSKVVYIHRDPLSNLPREIREAALDTLDRSINVINRKNKKRNFCCESSEDAVTWTIFRHLEQTGQLRPVLAELGAAPAKESTEEPIMLLWGVPVPFDGARGQECADRLIQVIDEIQRNPRSRSEPDVVLDFGSTGVVFIEVKFTSVNESKNPSYRGWAGHVEGSQAFRSPDRAKQSRLYELARNWRIGWEYAGERPFSLINLGQSGLFRGEKMADALSLFSSVLSQDVQHTFCQVEWLRLMQAILDKPRWLLKYDSDRGVSVGRLDLVRPIFGPRGIADCLQELRDVHEYLRACGQRAFGRAAEQFEDVTWGSKTKRLQADLPCQGRPYLVPRRLMQHNMIEIVNQCATLERLLELLEWASTRESGFADYTVAKCHPSTSSEKGGDKTDRDHDLVLMGPNDEAAYFEVSDVATQKDGNRKEARDLISLGVLAGEKASPRYADTWPSGQLFLVGSREFAEGVLKRKPKWISEGHCHYEPSHISDSTTVMEVRRGPSAATDTA